MRGTRRQIIEATIRDAVADVMFYRRKEDEDLPVGGIEEAIAAGEVTVKDMVEWFCDELMKSVPSVADAHK